jgi:hypothetical protein
LRTEKQDKKWGKFRKIHLLGPMNSW